MEDYFNSWEKLGVKPGQYAGEAFNNNVMRNFGTQRTGPPLKVD